MNYFLLGDILWYLGHILSGCSILFSHTSYHAAVTLALFGQFLTMISRPIGRINLNNKGAIKQNA
jgi:hypothetical protein